MTRTRGVIGAAAIATVALSLVACQVLGPGKAEPSPVAVAASSPAPVVVAAAGRVEPVSEEINIASEITGRLQEVMIDEGDRIRQGQILAVIENGDYRARLALAEAQLLWREAELRRLVNGAREEERLEAAASVAESRAVLEHASSELDRYRRLFAGGDVSRSDFDRVEREYLVAKARVEAASEHHAAVDAKVRAEDRDRAEAEVAAAKAQVDLAKAFLEKTIIRSPISGVVLRRRLRAGESVSDTYQTVIATIADDRVLRVRVDVDESDVAKLRLGQAAYVTANAYGDRRFPGRVVRVGQILGRKNIHTDAPTERIDAKILETLVELDKGQRLPVGLRVNAFILVE